MVLTTDTPRNTNTTMTCNEPFEEIEVRDNTRRVDERENHYRNKTHTHTLYLGPGEGDSDTLLVGSQATVGRYYKGEL